MMARQVAKQFYRLREVHSLVYGRGAGGRNSGENGRKLTASTRVGSGSRLRIIWLKLDPARGFLSYLQHCWTEHRDKTLWALWN